MRAVFLMIVVFGVLTACDAQTRPKVRRRPVNRRRLVNVTASAAALSERVFSSFVYDAAVRPVTDDKKAVEVRLHFYLTGIRDVDQRAHRVGVTGLLCSRWRDPRLRWAKRYYGNISAVRASETSIWTPDIQTATLRATKGQAHWTPAVVSNDGNVTRCVFTEVKTFCRLDTRTFPHDEHLCVFLLLPNGLRSGLVTITNYESNQVFGPLRFGEWIVRSIRMHTHLSRSSNQVVEMSSLIVGLKLQRSSSHYTYSVCVPTIALLIATMFASWLPARHLESRRSLLAGLMLAFVLLQRHNVQLVEGAPRLPDILRLHCMCTALVAASAVSACLLQTLADPPTSTGVRLVCVSTNADTLMRTALSAIDSLALPLAGAFLFVWAAADLGFA